MKETKASIDKADNVVRSAPPRTVVLSVVARLGDEAQVRRVGASVGVAGVLEQDKPVQAKQRGYTRTTLPKGSGQNRLKIRPTS